MSLYLPVNTGGSTVAIAICGRCKIKRQYDDLIQDENNQQYYCKFGCVDKYDPWRLPAPAPEDLALHHPRPDEDLV